jgi:CRISPR-associated endonuclease Csn1
MLASDPKFSDRKRNRDNDYSHTAKRSDLEDEARKIFQAQRCFENAHATEELERQFRDTAFSQRPLQDSEHKVGNCPFQPDRKRTAKRAPSFELFRFLQRLVNLRIAVGRAERSLRPEEIGLVLKKFGEQKSYTYKALRKDLDLDPKAVFSAIARNGEWLDIAARKGRSAFGTCVLREVLGAGPWHSLLKTPEKLDRIAEILTFREDLTSIREGLAEIGLDGPVIDRLMQAASEGVSPSSRAPRISLPSPPATSLSECARDSSTQKPARGQVTTIARAGLSRLTKLATESLYSVRLSSRFAR